jgi:hypothetical protein
VDHARRALEERKKPSFVIFRVMSFFTIPAVMIAAAIVLIIIIKLLGGW